jgi:hypothetical protein
MTGGPINFKFICVWVVFFIICFATVSAITFYFINEQKMQNNSITRDLIDGVSVTYGADTYTIDYVEKGNDDLLRIEFSRGYSYDCYEPYDFVNPKSGKYVVRKWNHNIGDATIRVSVIRGNNVSVAYY